MRKKQIITAFAAALLACTVLAGCGGNGAAAPVDSAVLSAAPVSFAGQAFDEEQYKAKITELSGQAQTIASALSGINTETDMQRAMEHLRGLRTPIESFLTIDTIPEKYTAAHEQFKAGYQSYLDYINLTIEYVEKNGLGATGDAAQEYNQQAQPIITSALNALSQGSTLAQEADAAK